MKKTLLITLLSIIITASCFVFAQDSNKILLIRQAKQDRTTTVAVEAHLNKNILEVLISARMYGTKPRIISVTVNGPKLGRLSSKTKSPVLARIEDEEPYPTKKRRAFISFSGEKNKKAKGTLTREFLTFIIPKDKIKPDKKYELYVKVQGTGHYEGKWITFKFELEDLYAEINK